MRRKMRMLAIVVLVLAGLAGAVRPASAVGVWWEGVVTQAPVIDAVKQEIGVNKITFTVLPDAGIHRKVVDSDGIVHEEPISLRDVREGDKVLVRIQGHRIHQILVVR